MISLFSHSEDPMMIDTLVDSYQLDDLARGKKRLSIL
jgi:hypothetical protein